jgi:hypothetical protein
MNWIEIRKGLTPRAKRGSPESGGDYPRAKVKSSEDRLPKKAARATAALETQN